MTPRATQFMLEEEYEECPVCGNVLVEFSDRLACLHCEKVKKKREDEE